MSNSDHFSKVAADYDAVFNLIDVVFSLESCLQYQILPLELDGEHLILGMIDPRDKEAVKFVSPIIQSLGYTFHTQAIDTQTHQLVLAAYLKSSPNDTSPREQVEAKQQTSSDKIEGQSQGETLDHATNNSATLFDIPEEFKAKYGQGSDATLVDIPNDFKTEQNEGSDATLVDIPEEFKAKYGQGSDATLVDIPNDFKTEQNEGSDASLVDIPEEFKAKYGQGSDATLVDIPDEAIAQQNGADFVDISEESIAAKLIDSLGNLNSSISAQENQNKADTNDPSNSATLFELPEEIVQSLQDLNKQNDSATLFERPEEIVQKFQAAEHPGESAEIIKSPEEPELKINSELNQEYSRDQEVPLTLNDKIDEPIKPMSKKELKSNQTMVIDSAELEQLKIYSSTPQLNNLKINTDEKNSDRQSVTSAQNPKLEADNEILSNSNPEILWQQLLGKIVSGQIDKLYFQHKENFGSILSGHSGAVSPLLDKLDIAVFEAIVNQIKVMAKLPLKKLDKYRKVAIPKLYNKDRVLLRVEFFPSRHGEEITMQMLQGEALRFYEQRQADRTMEQAISLSQKLEKALGKMTRYQGSIELNDLKTLNTIVDKIGEKLQSLN